MRTTVSQAQIGKLVQRLVIGQYAILVEVSSGRFLHARHSSAFGRNVGNNDIAVRRIFRMIKPPGKFSRRTKLINRITANYQIALFNAKTAFERSNNLDILPSVGIGRIQPQLADIVLRQSQSNLLIGIGIGFGTLAVFKRRIEVRHVLVVLKSDIEDIIREFAVVQQIIIHQFRRFMAGLLMTGIYQNDINSAIFIGRNGPIVNRQDFLVSEFSAVVKQHARFAAPIFFRRKDCIIFLVRQMIFGKGKLGRLIHGFGHGLRRMLYVQFYGDIDQKLVFCRTRVFDKLNHQPGILFFVVGMPFHFVYLDGHFGIKLPSQFFNRGVFAFRKFWIFRFVDIHSVYQVSDNLHVARSVICSHKLKKFKLENIICLSNF